MIEYCHFIVLLELVKVGIVTEGCSVGDIPVAGLRIIIDAKPMLGVLSLDLTRALTVKYGGENMQFENVLSKYATA